jgi:hypothetical protein
MIFVAYAVFLTVTVGAFSLITAGQRPRPDGSPLRVVTLFISLTILLLNVTLVPQQHDATSVGTLIVGGGVVGSALFAIGAANWTGTAAFSLRTIGWLLTAIVFAIPSTLTLGLPLVGVLAFAVVPISGRHTVEQKQPRSVAA